MATHAMREQDLISKLLVLDITNRLGCLKDGVRDIKSHVWFSQTSWDIDIMSAGPVIPAISTPGDTRNFYPANEPLEEIVPPFDGDQSLFSGF